MSNLTNEEKIIKKYYSLLVENANKYNVRKRSELIKNFCKEFSMSSIENSNYKNENIKIKNIRDIKTNGSMTLFDDKDAIFRINKKSF